LGVALGHVLLDHLDEGLGVPDLVFDVVEFDLDFVVLLTERVHASVYPIDLTEQHVGLGLVIRNVRRRRGSR
jgi:hypothetical protein